MFHSQLAFLKTCSMLFLQVKCLNLLFRLLISRATFTTGLENQLEVNFARVRRSSLHLPIKRLGTEWAGYAGFWVVCKSPWWDNYLCRWPRIDFKHKGRICNESRKKTSDFKQDRWRTGFENDKHATANFSEINTLIPFSKKNGYVLTETPFYVAYFFFY